MSHSFYRCLLQVILMIGLRNTVVRHTAGVYIGNHRFLRFCCSLKARRTLQSEGLNDERAARTHGILFHRVGEQVKSSHKVFMRSREMVEKRSCQPHPFAPSLSQSNVALSALAFSPPLGRADPASLSAAYDCPARALHGLRFVGHVAATRD